jgi:hypothetical protein
MKYLLFDYGERPLNSGYIPKTKYCYSANLNVLLSNNKPAIKGLSNLGTQTFSKVEGESSDSDIQENIMQSTKTLTLVDIEQSDSDKENYTFANSLSTITNTRVEMESTDSDI